MTHSSRWPVIRMDELDQKILSILKEDARMAYTEMARTLDLSEGAVRQRVRGLTESGIIKRFTVETSQDLPKAVVFISASARVPVPRIAENFSALQGVESVMEVAGQSDILVVVSGRDISSVNQSIDAIRAVEGVQSTNTFFVLRMWR